MEKEVIVKYDSGHSIEYTYRKSEGVHCPNCGKQEVWSETGEGDYYVGPTLICGACDFLFHMPTTGRSDEITRQLRGDAK